MQNVFGNRLKAARKAKGMTQTDLGKAVNVTKGTVSSWETGMRLPNINTLVQLADLLSCTTDYLLGRADYGSEERTDYYADTFF